MPLIASVYLGLGEWQLHRGHYCLSTVFFFAWDYGGIIAHLLSVARLPLCVVEARGFASPPLGGFAFIATLERSACELSY
jgi:hypothetical protein